MPGQSFQFGIDQLLADSERLKTLQQSRVGLVAHPASITSDYRHSLDALVDSGCNIVKAFGPQHGMRGEKQDNMIESDDYLDPLHHVPVISLYGEFRRPQDDMLEDLDIVLFDLQDVGCRIYTFITTLYYFAEACARLGTELWVLDRPNPAGRPVDGLRLVEGQESFVGCAPLPTRYGLTIGELAGWFKDRIASSGAPPLNLSLIAMGNYSINEGPGYGWPVDRPWINPSPNAASVNMTRCFPGTVLLEGTTLSEGRGTTVPLEVIGAPGLDIAALIDRLKKEVPEWSRSVILRSCHFSPTFHKHAGELCAGVQIHTDFPEYDHEDFKPYRLIAAMLKIVRELQPDIELWRHHEYEYELDRTPIDVISGGPTLREWVDNADSGFDDLNSMIETDISSWLDEREPYLIYQP